ncbi:MAG: VWA domain-containing protein [Saprospiraceae bacterium]|nr:VWA domain-containing protein [Saprospiraceae bacterium]MBK6814177.1 VWA domain-containing protein [Saprospiraceae bacterium]MBK8776179.1 VWA domain-containing protein [Saprospiraceae bacterium]MBK9931252.1 VWA domain-containing protein [Saprospiraceae bacterium]MBP7800249.1 VWA domain-containing protein [Saprospiraceae bacterium]
MDSFAQYRLVYPWALALLALLPFLILAYRRNRKTPMNAVYFGHTPSNIKSTWKNVLHYFLPWLQAASFILLCIGLSRPQHIWKEEKIKANAIDIFLAVDLSSSMLAQDFQPDRLSVSKQVAQNFVNKRIYDRLGLAVFAGESYTRCPLTTDHEVFKNFLAEINVGKLDDGTAIGMGLSAAINRLKNSTSKSKIIILLTDGVNNTGYIDPLTAAQIAKEFNIKIYAIGVGSMGEALTPVTRRGDGQYVFAMARVEIDEKLMTQVSEMTGGKYYRATDEEALQKIYDEIDKLEKTEVEVTKFTKYTETFHYFVGVAALLLILHFIIKYFIIKQVID